MKLYPLLLCMILVASAIFISGCGSSATSGYETGDPAAGETPEGDSGESFAPETEANGSEVSGGQAIQENAEGAFSAVTHAYVDAVPATWDSESNVDGIIVYPKLKDANEETVQYEGTEIGVDIEVWTTKFDENTIEVRDRMVYSSTFTIDSWEYGHITDDIITDRGIRIPFESISALPTDSPYGGVFIKMHMPGGIVYEASQPVGVQIRGI